MGINNIRKNVKRYDKSKKRKREIRQKRNRRQQMINKGEGSAYKNWKGRKENRKERRDRAWW